MRLRNAIGETIRELRQEKKMNLRTLSSVSFVSLGHLSEIERGIKSVSPEVLECLTYGLDTPTWKFLMEVAHKLSITEGVEIPDNLAELMEKENA